MELHDAQTGFRAGTRFGSGRNCRTLKCMLYFDCPFRRRWNYRVLKLEKMFRMLHRGFDRREITWAQTGFFDVPMDFRFGKVWNCRVLKLHMVLEDVITSLASKNQHLDFNVLRFWERKKLQGTQTTTITKPRRCTVWKRKKLQGSQAEMVHLYYANLYYATNTKKLQGTQTQETQSDARHRV